MFVFKDEFRENKINFREKVDISRMFVCVCVCKADFRENKINFREKDDISGMFVCCVCKDEFREN